jgi:glucose-6-phosphate isomerase
MDIQELVSRFDPATGAIAGAPLQARRLSDLRGCFADAQAYAAALAAGDPVVYTVADVAPAQAAGDLHYAIGRLMPGRIGSEYYMTRGHMHAWRAAAELYIGLSGEGLLLLEHEAGGASRIVPLRRDELVYVPGHTAHRTVNTGSEPLSYLGVYPAAAGHDYEALARTNFRCVVIERDGRALMLPRSSRT